MTNRQTEKGVMPNTNRRRDAIVELRRVGVGCVNTLRNFSRRLSMGAFTPPTGIVQLDFAVGKFVQTRRDCRQLVANCIHRRRHDSTRQLSRVGGVYWA